MNICDASVKPKTSMIAPQVKVMARKENEIFEGRWGSVAQPRHLGAGEAARLLGLPHTCRLIEHATGNIPAREPSDGPTSRETGSLRTFQSLAIAMYEAASGRVDL